METLRSRVTEQFGAPLAAALPDAGPRSVGPSGDSPAAFAALLTSLRGAAVVLFNAVTPARLDSFFRLRLAQILKDEPPLPSLSVVVLTPAAEDDAIPGGFADRFRTSWPFARCVFVTTADAAALQAVLALPVTRLDAGPAIVLQPETAAGQPVALQIQGIQGCGGGTTAFQNQMEELVRAGYFTIRVFSDGGRRAGPTLDAVIDGIIAENNRDAAGHIEVAAVPRTPLARRYDTGSDVAWAAALAEEARCDLDEPDVRAAAAKATVAVANHLRRTGLALRLAPEAKLLLDVHDDLGSAYRQLASLTGAPAAEAEAVAARAAAAQAAVLPVADICTHVNLPEIAALSAHCRRSAIVLPRPYVQTVPLNPDPEYDLLLVGDQHPFNILSFAWFLQHVWQPHLAALGVSAAIAGRVAEHPVMAATPSPLLHLAGFVPDLEALRARCRLTVVPDCGGAGLSIKMLTTLAAGHPVATTSIGLRGFDPAVARLLPSFDAAAALAADILALRANPTALAARRAAVRAARDALRGGPGYVAHLADLPPPSEAERAERMARWQAAIAPALQAAVAPYHFILDVPFAMTGTVWDDQLLRSGWLPPEAWGRWMDGTHAELVIRLAEPAAGPLGLDLDLVPSPANATLSIMVGGAPLATIQPAAGVNRLLVPLALIDGLREFTVGFHASAAVSPAAAGNSRDARVLGVGFRAATIVARTETLLPVGEALRVSATTLPWDLLVDGWHPCEDWGCWSSSRMARLQLRTPEPLHGRMELQLDLFPAAPSGLLTLWVNGEALPPVRPVDGLNCWQLPRAATDGATVLLIGLDVAETTIPAATAPGADDRTLGIGLRAIRLVCREPTLLALDQEVTVKAGAVPWDLLLDHWHAPEPWGCWSDCETATIQLRLREAAAGPLALDLRLTTAAPDAAVSVAVNGVAADLMEAGHGLTRCLLPAERTAGVDLFQVRLSVTKTLREATESDEPARVLGVSLRSLCLSDLAPPTIQVGQWISFQRPAIPDHLLVAGWQKPEEWGTWTGAPDAVLALRLDPPLRRAHDLQLDLARPLRPQPLTLRVNGVTLPARLPVTGENVWRLPRAVTQDCAHLLIGLHVPDTVNPAEGAASADDRSLGVGVRALRLATAAITTIPLNQHYPISSRAPLNGMLDAGWHPPEPWGCWSAAPEATLILTFEEPLAGPHSLELNLAPPLLRQDVTVTVNGIEVFSGAVRNGVQAWRLPEGCTDGQMDLRIALVVDRLASPAEAEGSVDWRRLGVGIRAAGLFALGARNPPA